MFTMKDYLEKALNECKPVKEGKSAAGEDYVGTKPLHAVIKKSIPNFKKEYPEFYKILKFAFNDRELESVASRAITDAINALSKEKAVMMQKMNPKDLEKEIFSLVNVVLSGDIATKALKIQNKALKNKVDMLKAGNLARGG